MLGRNYLFTFTNTGQNITSQAREASIQEQQEDDDALRMTFFAAIERPLRSDAALAGE
jgi:hypothetical protein